MSTTPNIGLELVPSNSLQPWVAVNESLKLLDGIVQIGVQGVANDPPTTVAGDVGKSWIVGGMPTGAFVGHTDDIALCTAPGLWLFFTAGAQIKFLLNLDNGGFYCYDSSWVLAGGLSDAPSDGTAYVRKNATWVAESGGGGGGIPDAPSDGNTYGRKNSAWSQLAAGGDVVGPASATSDRIAVFDGATGKLLKDGGLTIADLYFDSVTAATISSGTVTLNCNGGRVRNFTIALTANATLAVSNLAPAGRVTEFEVQITQDATGSRTLTLPGSFKALGGSDTAISAAANSVTILSAKTFDGGTTWRYAMQESA